MIPTDLEITAQQILLILPMLMRIMAAEFRQMQRALLPAHLSVMFILSQGSCNLSELAEQLAVSPPTMSNTVSKLVADGLVTVPGLNKIAALCKLLSPLPGKPDCMKL
ncbi:MAG: MarR family transcriptional regulator [Chloroflexota bacterium]